ncbi:DUF2817 domain-containing protein, partial [Myxococcota bacterium]|nr:DUF2817 domain-containing protein [Myxococcota bacterium]
GAERARVDVTPELPPASGLVGAASSAASRATGRAAVDVRAAALPPILPAWNVDAIDAKIAELSRRELDGRSRIEVTRLGAIDHTSLYAISLPAERAPKLRVLVTGGVHGSEACGPAAALGFVDHLLAHPELRRDVEVTVVPLVNPYGYKRKLRANGDGLDVNRHASDAPDAPREIALLREAIAGDEFDLAIDLHASGSVGKRGFFAIHDGGAELLHPTMADFATRHRVVSETTELYTMDAPGIFQSRNANTLKAYMKARGTKWSYTVEAPAKQPYEYQVRGLVDFLDSATKQGLLLRAREPA